MERSAARLRSAPMPAHVARRVAGSRRRACPADGDASPVEANYTDILRAAKAGDPLTASQLLAESIRAGAAPSARACGAVVVASTNVRDLAGAEASIALLRAAGHGVAADLARMIVLTSLSIGARRGGAGPAATLEEVGRWLRRLHADGILPLTVELVGDVAERFSDAEMVEEASAWASLALAVAMQAALTV